MQGTRVYHFHAVTVTLIHKVTWIIGLRFNVLPEDTWARTVDLRIWGSNH